MNNQTAEQLKQINAKRTLGLPLTAHEKALQTLYGQANTDTQNTPDEQTCKDIALDVCCALITPLADIFAPVIDAIVDIILLKIKNGGGK